MRLIKAVLVVAALASQLAFSTPAAADFVPRGASDDSAHDLAGEKMARAAEREAARSLEHGGQGFAFVFAVLAISVGVVLLVVLLVVAADSGNRPAPVRNDPEPTPRPVEPERPPEPEAPPVSPGSWLTTSCESNEALFDEVFRAWEPEAAEVLARGRGAEGRGDAWEAKRDLAKEFEDAVAGKDVVLEKDDDHGEHTLVIRVTGESRRNARKNRDERVYQVTIESVKD